MNPVETVQAIQEADRRAREWPADVWLEVALEAPEHLEDLNTHTWAATVETWRKPGETPVRAAKRLALYLTLHAESHPQVPVRLEAVAAGAIRRHREDEPMATCPVCAGRPREDCPTCGGLGVVL